MRTKLIKASAGAFAFCGIVAGLFEKIYAPTVIVTEGSVEFPSWVSWLGWSVASAATLTYIAADIEEHRKDALIGRAVGQPGETSPPKSKKWRRLCVPVIPGLRFAGSWIVALSIFICPLLVLLNLLSHSFDSDLHLPEKAVLAVGGMIALVISTAKSVCRDADEAALRTSVGWLVMSVIGLLFTISLKMLLFELWKGGFGPKDFSSGFDLAAASFKEVQHKRVSWLRYVLYVSLVFLYSTFVYGTRIFLVTLLPTLRRWEPRLTISRR